MPELLCERNELPLEEALRALLGSYGEVLELTRGSGTEAHVRFATHAQLEHLQQKYVGTGHADTTKFEWAVNQHRDSLALYVGFDSLTQYIAVAENESISRVKFNSLQKMIQRLMKK